ncbi:MAG: hypothetical protein KGJ78_12500 [Alphaproteobacteria bacterium]|nr:hypothetical protein [Alphaproteobacteria bacterium]
MKRFFTLLLSVAALALSPRAFAGPPFLADDPEPVEYQHWEVYIFSAATRVDGDTGGVLPGVEVNYGVVPDVQLHIVAPLAFDKPSGSGMRNGLGDTELGVKYRFLQEDERGWRPMVGVFPLVEVPSGDAGRGLGAGRPRIYLPVWLQKSFGKWLTYGGGGYWINPGPGNRNHWFAGWLLQRQITASFALGGELFHQTPDTIGGKESTGYNVGGVYDFSENHHLLFSVGSGLQNAGTTNSFSYYLAFQWTLP